MANTDRVSTKRHNCPNCKGNNRELGKPCPSCGFPLTPEEYAGYVQKVQAEIAARKVPKCTCCPLHKCG